MAEAEARQPAVVVVDSVQAVSSPSLASTPGTVSQVRAVAAELTRYAKSRGVPVLLVGHVTKDGNLAGPKSLEHLVDAVVSIEGDRGGSRRLLRATKNRFGPVDEIALYEMTGEGLAELPDASAVLLAERRAGLPGSAVTAAREGTRSVLVEIQALVGSVSAGSPRRVAIGLDGGRLALLLAVLEGAGLALSSREVFVSCTGGIEVTEPAADLAVSPRSRPRRARRPFPTGACSSARSGCSRRGAAGAGGRVASEGGLGPRIPDGLSSGRQRRRSRRVHGPRLASRGPGRGISRGALRKALSARFAPDDRGYGVRCSGIASVIFRKASRYFSRVVRTTPSGSFGAGGFLSQPVDSSQSRTNCLSNEAWPRPG